MASGQGRTRRSDHHEGTATGSARRVEAEPKTAPVRSADGRLDADRDADGQTTGGPSVQLLTNSHQQRDAKRGGGVIPRPSCCSMGISDAEQFLGAGVGARVTQLRHGPCLDLADALAGEVEVLAHVLEGAGLAAVEAEAQAQDL